jgi:type IV secretion system protein VirD4
MKGIPIGFDENGKPRSYKGDGHLFLAAPPRSGKGRDILIPALLQYESSCIVIDPKGQLAAVTAAQRMRMGHKVIILNPFRILEGQLPGETATFNPMDALDPKSESFGTDCDSLADGIVKIESGRDAHWSESAHELISGVMMQLAANFLPVERNFVTMRRLIAAPNSDLVTFARVALESSDPFIADRLGRFSELEAKNGNEVASIISTARTQTKFISNAAIANSLARSSFRFSSLRREPTTAYLILPTRYLGTCAKWFRVVVASAMNELLREPEPDDLRVLMVLDEAAQLGPLQIIEHTLGIGAGLGLQLWPIFQDLSQVRDLYPRRWESFLGCAGVQMFFAPREFNTSEEVSKLCGDTTVTVMSSSKGTTENSGRGGFDGTKGTSEGTSTSLAHRRAMLPQEVRQMGGDEFLLFADVLQGHYAKMKRVPYWVQPACHDPEGKPLYSTDPYHSRKLSCAGGPETRGVSGCQL